MVSALAGLCCFLAGAGVSAAPAALYPDHPLAGTLWNAHSGRQVSEDSFLKEALGARWVLLGEKHDNAEHHRRQAQVVGALAQAGRRPAVIWEMAQPEQAAALRAARLANVDALEEALDWEARGWPAWEEYRPIAEQALIHGLAMHPGKPSTALVRQVSRGEPPPPELALRFGFDEPYPAEIEAELLEELEVSHCGRLPVEALPAMARVQRLWDAWMAAAMLTAAEESEGAVLIAGAGHVRRDRAVPWQLQRAGEDPAEIVTLALVEVAAGRSDAADYGSFDPLLFDFVWFTPRVDEKDPCADFPGGSAQ